MDPDVSGPPGPRTPPLVLVVDVTSALPPYEQVRSQVAAHVAAGRLVPGDRLPSVRALAADLGIAVGTVARAYRELEAAGQVVSRRRTGTVVTAPAGGSASPDAAAAAGRTERVRAAAVEVARVGRDAGWDDEQVLAAVRGALLGISQEGAAPAGGPVRW